MVSVYYPLWAFVQAGLTISGALIYSWYPTLITTNYWWQNQCPVTSWTSTSAAITAAGSLLVFASRSSDTNTVATKFPVQGTWTQSQCLSASPVKNWGLTALIQMAMFGLVTIVWCINSAVDNEGGSIHSVFLWTTRGLIFFVAAQLYFTYLAYKSYGTRD
jgi:hypothetical protein